MRDSGCCTALIYVCVGLFVLTGRIISLHYLLGRYVSGTLCAYLLAGLYTKAWVEFYKSFFISRKR